MEYYGENFFYKKADIENDKYEEYEEYEEEKDEEDSSSRINKKLIITNSDRSLNDIVNWAKRGKLIIPPYQRNYVWDNKKKSFLIESLLLGFPIPSLILFENGDKFELIDGKQRVLTILKYLNPDIKNFFGNELEEIKLNKLNKSSPFWNKKFNDFSLEKQEDFKETLLSVTIFDGSKHNDESELKKLKYEIFRRINTGAELLYPQEIRNALWEGQELEEIKKLSQEVVFLNLVKNDKKLVYDNSKNRKDQDEFILRLLSYKSYFFNKKFKKNKFKDEFKNINNKQEFINQYMSTIFNNLNLLIEEIKLMKTKLTLIFNYDQNAFYNLKRNTNFESISNSVFQTFAEALYIYSCQIDNFKIGKSLKELKEKICQDEEKYKCFFQSTTTLENVEKRVNLIEEYFESH